MPFNINNEWHPTRKQELFLSIPDSIKEAGFGGGAGSGKSELLLVIPLVRQWYKNPKFKQVFMRRTYPELRNEIVPRSRELYRPFGAKYNKQEMTWTFLREDQYGAGTEPAGSIIYLAHCENEDDVHKYDSMEINLYTPDELTSFVEYIYLYIGFTRVRTSDKSLPAIIRTAFMPGGIGHTFVKKRYIDPYPAGGKIIVGKGNIKRIFIHATQADNPHIDPDYKNSLQALPEHDKQAKLYGSFDAYLGQVFEEFRDKQYPDEPENALHVIESMDIPEWWPKIVVGDWGFRAMTWIGFGAISPDKRLYVYRELYWYKTKISTWGAVAREFIEKENPRITKFCKSAGQDRGQEHTIQEQIEEALGISIELSSNTPGSRIAGKMLLHEYLRWAPKITPKQEARLFNNEHAMWLLRNRGESEYNSYLDSFRPAIVETNIPKLQIVGCPILVNAIKSAVYAKSKEGKPVEDIAEFDGDDPLDGIRYMIDLADSLFNDVDEMQKLKANEDLINKLQTSQDWTAFYRDAKRIESTSIITPVSRFHMNQNA